MDRVELDARELKEVTDIIGERAVDKAGLTVVVVPAEMWDSALADERAVFVNVVRIEAMKYRVESVQRGGAFLCAAE